MVTAWWACTDVDGAGHGNFGDVLTPYIIKALTGVDVMHSREADHILMCGSILNQSNENSIILGAGFMSECDVFDTSKQVHLVRGVLSKAILNEYGIGHRAMVGDPAIILPLIYKPKVNKRHRIGIVPHYVDFDEANKLKHRVIDVTWPVEAVINWICECDYIVTSSLHGLIVAQAYGIPAAWVQMSDKLGGDDLKFRDYITTNAPTMPQYPIDLRYSKIEELKYYWGDFQNRAQVYKLLNTKLNELLPKR